MARARHGKKKRRGLKIFIFLVICALIGGGVYFYLNQDKLEEVKEKLPIKKLKIVDEDSKTRPIAVMINNNHAAWPHAGLQDAYLSYEIIAEGGITRIMALFKDQDTEKIGSVRSARPYYLDYALENDAIYVHYGWSDKAKSDIASLGVDNINGLTDNKTFWRDTKLNKATEHTVFTSMEKIKETASEAGYMRDTNKDLLLQYSIDEISLKKKEGALKADNVYIKYSYYTDTSYEYDKENKVYKRYVNGKEHKDYETNEQYTFKNIITYQVNNYTLNDGENKGRQELENIGSGSGYYISNGYSIPIKWEKKSRSSQTKYYYENGDELKVNDGNTFIQIQPKGQKLTIS